jgi:hypothetical protein
VFSSTVFCKYITAQLRHRTFCGTQQFVYVNILRDVNICFIASFVHVNYLIFLGKLKRGGP